MALKGHYSYLFVMILFVISISEYMQVETQTSNQFVVDVDFKKKHIRSGDCIKVYSLGNNTPENFEDNLKSTANFWRNFTKSGFNAPAFSRYTNTFIIAHRTVTDIEQNIAYAVKMAWPKCKTNTIKNNVRDCVINMADHGCTGYSVAVMKNIMWNEKDLSAKFKSCLCGQAVFNVSVKQTYKQNFIYHFGGQVWLSDNSEGTGQFNVKSSDTNTLPGESNNIVSNTKPKTCH